MLLTQNQKLKFAVRSPNLGKIKSGVWVAWIKKDDLYIVEKNSSGILKVSLHASGVCNYSLTSEFMTHEPPKENLSRKIISWTRGDFAGVEHAKTLEIHFILIAGGIEKLASTADLTLIPDAPTGFTTEVAVFYSATNPLEWESRFWPKTNIMAVWNLSSGAFVCFQRRVIPLPDSEFQRILDLATGLPLLGIGEENPEVISGGFSALQLSECFPHLGRIFVIEKMNMNSMMGQQTNWHTRDGNQPKCER